MMRIMGLDYGTKTVGVAVSDPLGITAQAVETVKMCIRDRYMELKGSKGSVWVLWNRVS